MVTIYVGRWDQLPKRWEGFNGLVEKSEDEISLEVVQEGTIGDIYVGKYTQENFENMFNGDLIGDFNNEKYWIKIF